MNVNYELCTKLEKIAGNAWPAEKTTAVGDWLLRASQGVTKRANSVLALGAYPLDSAWLQNIESFYQEHRLPSLLQISDASPAGLDELLDRNGYGKELPCLVLSADSRTVEERTSKAIGEKKQADIDISWTDQADVNWLDAFLRLEHHPQERRGFYLSLFERTSNSKGFISLQKDGAIVAVATVVIEDGWAGFFNVIVDESQRRQGLGYLLLHAMTAWSLEKGAVKQYLQVTADNKPAISLYTKLGYQFLYNYHYRAKYDLQTLASS